MDRFEHVNAEERLRRPVVLDCIRSLFREMKRVENGTEGGGGRFGHFAELPDST